MSENAMVPVSFEQLPALQIGDDKQFAELAKGGVFLKRLQLFTKSKENIKGLISQGHYGIKESEEEIIDLGTSVNVFVLARRPKAIDMTDMDALVINYDMESKEFQRIRDRAAETNSHCQFGPSFLIYEQSTSRFLEFFCGNKSARREANKFYSYLPITQARIDALAAAGNDVSDLTANRFVPMTLTTVLTENKYGSWHAPKVTKCSVPVELPEEAVVVREIHRFLTVKDNGVERIEETKPARAR